MTPLQYLEEIVLPTISESRDDPESRRKAYLAAIVTHHIGDYLKAAGATNPWAAVERRAGAAARVVRAVANGAKHSANPRDKNTVRFQAGSDYFRPSAAAGAMECGSSALGDAFGHITVEAEDGLWVPLMDCVRTLVHAYVGAYHADHFGDFATSRLQGLESLPAELVGF